MRVRRVVVGLFVGAAVLVGGAACTPAAKTVQQQNQQIQAGTGGLFFLWYCSAHPNQPPCKPLGPSL
jgi:hypothetical protein